MIGKNDGSSLFVSLSHVVCGPVSRPVICPACCSTHILM